VTLQLKDLEAFLGAPPEAGLDPYLDAASVLAAFDPVELRPLGDVAGEPPIDRLLPHCEPITEGAARGLWSLVLADRRAALRRLGTPEAMKAALAANPERPRTPVQKLFERVLRGAPLPLEELNREELAAAATVGEWLRGLVDDAPQEADVRRALARQDLTAPMRRLTAGGFVDRKAELAWLHDFVGGPPPGAPLFVHGPGGVGKSTLLAKLLLEEFERPGRAIAYLDIDRPAINPELPPTLLLDALAQLRQQLELPPHAVGLAEQIAEALGRIESMRQAESVAPPHDYLAPQFGELLGHVPEHTAIIAVDTFEEAQFLGPDVVWPLVETLFELARATPTARVIVAGRALPEELPGAAALPAHIDLGVLDDESARELVALGLAHEGLAPLEPHELDDVVRLVSTNPMSLRLAVRLLRDEGIDQFRARPSQVLARMKAEKVQAFLYGRILQHIHAADVRRIAYPGLIVRRITPDVIREVLAGPCKVELTPSRDEHAIHWDLAREAALVERDPDDGSLRQRVDVRRAMLPDLTDHVRPETAAAIDAAAVAFYERQDGVIARAEELYHRLRRCDPPAVLEDRWLPEAGARLTGAAEELPPQPRLWLAEKLGATAAPEIREAASQDEWELQARRSADRYLRSRRAEQALEILHERSERKPRSELYALESEAYRFLRRHDDALKVARVGVESMTRDGAIDGALELLLKMVNIEEGRGGVAAAAELAAEAAAVASHSGDELLRLRADVTGRRVRRRTGPEASDPLPPLPPHVLHGLRARPVLLREVAAESLEPPVLSIAFETLGVEVATERQAELLGHALVALRRASARPLAKELEEPIAAFEHSGSDPVIVREWSMRRTSGGDARVIARAIAGYPPGDPGLTAFREYFRAGMDHALGVP